MNIEYKHLIRLLLVSILINPFHKYANAGFAGILEVKVPGILVIKDDLGTVSDMIISDLRSMSYNVNEVIPEQITPELVAGHDLTILSTGTNQNPCQNIFMRNILISHANAGGRILLEGGQNGYVSAVFPGYAAFLNKVVKSSAWLSDSGGEFQLNGEFSESKIANVPNQLPENISVSSGSNYYQDVCTRMETSLLLYKCSLFQNSAGVIVFPFIDSVQIINMCFSYNAIDRSVSKNLMANFMNALVGSPIGINITNLEIPEQYILHNNYPNPFNSSTNVRFSIPELTEAKMKIYSLEGKLISEIFDRSFEPGHYEVKISASNLASGIYFLLFQTKEYKGLLRLSHVK